MKIYIQIRGKPQGPCPVEEIKSLLANGWLSPTDLGQYEGDTDWKPLSSMPELHLETPAEPAPEPEPIAEEILPPEPPAKERKPIPWKPILATLAVIAAVGVLGYYGVVLFEKVRANPPKIFASIKKAITRSEKPAPAPATNSPTTTIQPTASRPQVKSGTSSATPTTTKTAALPPDIAMIDAGVIQETPLPNGLAAPRPVPAPPAKKEAPKRRYIASNEGLNPKLTPFGNYDVAMIQAIQKRWLQFLDEQAVAVGRTGKVVLEFRLNFLGRVSDLKVTETSGDDILAYLCQKAIQESEPFSSWPPGLRKLVKGDYRSMRFTFYF